MNNSSKKCVPLFLCTLIIALVATLIMTSTPVLGSRPLTRPSNGNNNVVPKDIVRRKNVHGNNNNAVPKGIDRKNVHGPRKLDEDGTVYPPQDFGLQPNPIGPGNYYSGGSGGYYPGGGGGGYYPGGGGGYYYSPGGGYP